MLKSKDETLIKAAKELDELKEERVEYTISNVAYKYEIECLKKENKQLKEQMKELKHIMYVIRDDNGLNHLWCKDMILNWLGSDVK